MSASFLSAVCICQLLLNNTGVGAALQKQNPPLIIHTFGTPEWQELTDVSSLQSPAFYSSDLGAVSHVNCTASYPITWNISGFIFPTEAINIPPCFSERNIFNNKFTITLSITFFAPALGLPDVGSSSRISCERVGNVEQKAEVFMFFNEQDQSPFVSLESAAVFNSTVIPCPTKNPTSFPILYKQNTNGTFDVVRNSSIIYHPTEGFLSTNVFDGIYLCKQNSYNKSITAFVSDEYIIRPIEKTVMAFSDDVIQLECSPRSHQSLQIVVNAFNPADISSLHTNTNGRNVVQIWLPYQNTSNVKGTAQCIAFDTRYLTNGEVVKEWEFEFVPPPQFRLDHQLQEIQCLSDVEDNLLETVRCWNPADCNYRSRCLADGTSCDFKKSSSSLSKTCWVEEIKEAKNCKRVPVSHFPGVVQCTVKGLVKRWEYFVSMYGLTYTDWREAQQKELIRVFENQNVTTGITTFICKAVTYLFSNNLKFEIMFKDGFKYALEDNRSTVNISNFRDWTELSAVSILQMRVPTETAVIYCHGGWWNETGTMNNYIEFSPRDDVNDKSSTLVYISLAVIVVVLIVVTALWFRSYQKYREAQKEIRILTEDEIGDFFQGRTELMRRLAGNQMDAVNCLPYNKKFEIPLDDLEFDSSEENYLGRGHFSYVVRGNILSKSQPVAIKVSKSSIDVSLFKSILSEVKIMIFIGQHENVVALVGVCTEGIRNRSIYIVTEICELGSLNEFLRNARPFFLNLVNVDQEINKSLLPLAIQAQRKKDSISTLDLIDFAGQIANGMEYLSSKLVIHADLAARNVLLTKEKVVKISDFGLSKKLYENRSYVKSSKTEVPWHWMPVESLSTLTFSTASDVYAYGVTLFEVFSLGEFPFPNEEWNKEFHNKLYDGLRLSRPKYCTSEIYNKLLACWDNTPTNRPNFETLKVFFQDMVTQYINNEHCPNVNVAAGVPLLADTTVEPPEYYNVQ